MLIFHCVCLVCDTNMYFSTNWYQSSLYFPISITSFVSFGIRDSNFIMLEDSTFNFLHGCWNYCFIKTDIDVIMLFEFDIKYVKLNFKAIASMVFSFVLKLNLLCSYDGTLFMKTIENYLVKILENSVSRVSTDREFPLINRMFLFNQSNRNRELIESTHGFVLNLLKFRLIENSFWSIEFAFSINQIGIENQSSHPDCLLKFSSWFQSIERYIRSIKSCEFWIFTKCFHI